MSILTNLSPFGWSLSCPFVKTTLRLQTSQITFHLRCLDHTDVRMTKRGSKNQSRFPGWLYNWPPRTKAKPFLQCGPTILVLYYELKPKMKGRQTIGLPS